MRSEGTCRESPVGIERLRSADARGIKAFFRAECRVMGGHSRVAKKYQEVAMDVAPRGNVKPTLVAENAFAHSEQDAMQAISVLNASPDRNIAQFAIQASAIQKMAIGLKNLTIAVRQVYDLLDEIKKTQHRR